MPSIPEYISRENSLTPSATGASAWEQTGRRLAPLYNEAATFQERQGKLAAQAEKQKMWPFDILRLYQIRATAAAQGSGSGFKVASRPGGATGNASDFDTPRYLNDGWTPGYDDIGQVSRGAAAIGNAVADGGYGVAKTGKPAAPGSDSGGGGGPDYTLYQGQFVTAADQRKIDATNRADFQQGVSDYGYKLSDYYQQYYGYQPNNQVQTGTGPVSNTNPYTPTANYNPPAPSSGFMQGVSDFITGGMNSPGDTGGF